MFETEYFKSILILVVGILMLPVACQKSSENGSETSGSVADTTLTSEMSDTLDAISEPLVDHMYTADPSAHVFDGTLYIYPSHDVESGIPQDDMGSHFDMRDYHVFSMEKVGGEVTDHGVALHVDDVPWASRQMWAPDAAKKGDSYYFYFPAKDENDVFRIGVATGDSPTGPFKPQPEPIEGSYSIDPAVYEDTDGTYYMYFGGIWGGQLQRWTTGEYVEEDTYPADDEPALSPKIARMSEDMLSFAEEPKDVQILDKEGNPITAGDNERRFFEAAWVHKYEGTYYLSYSTGDTHYIAYATGDNPYGPFTYQGIILEPVIGWTNHHSIAEFNGQWYLFYHDTELSGGQTHLRNIKMTELTHNPDGTIETIDPYRY
ncbi:glycoside hydrolase family 43 protein [Aliifodinibius sp. S!AR15-10]|uniref:glycoside hydrolase family 43 protein n=1 Tax=Aliifodinibius sp. S!AR15-10 TaxID=2950437 RepID=UPI002858B676|nr:glycoside hydrolase family 43 protein [Aliifodinibius sp. S!AR15-10]MDR8390177.1 glycoside hydrolase family 43 protein [Aliifodinibius sp. S!AR15-10]